MAIAVSGLQVEHREVDLKRKPNELTLISPKATVPVLQLNDGIILEESLDIMQWALNINDPKNWLLTSDNNLSADLLRMNDNKFKRHLDRYKYADRFPENCLEYYREKAQKFPHRLDVLLESNGFILSEQPSLIDIAIFPFIRQFAFVDKNWFDSMSWNNLKNWLDYFLESDLFLSVMKKHSPWKAGNAPLVLP